MVHVSGSTNARPRRAPRVVSPALHGTDPALARGERADAWTTLLDRLVGEVIMRHATGVRVLDLGRGSPIVADWVGARAASLDIVDAQDLGRGDEVRIPWPDASLDLVYCIRTLAHLGHDPQTSERAARSALAEIGRVLVPGGTALVEFENALSLWGAVHGLRRPAKALERGPLVIDSPRGLTRFDTLPRALALLPDHLVMTGLHGLRIVTPLPRLLMIPVVGRVLSRLEWVLRDRPIVRRLGGHLLLVVRHQGKPFPHAALAEPG